MKKWLIALVVVLGLAYGGFKVYTYYEVKDVADRLVRLAAPVALVRYQGVHTAIDGSAGIEGVDVTVPTTGEIVRVGRVAIDAQTPWGLLALGERFGSGKPPRSLGVRIEGVRLDLRSRYIKLAAQGAADDGRSGGCRGFDRLPPAAYRAMGYDELVVDLFADYALDGNRRGLTLEATLTVHDAYRAQARVGLALDQRPATGPGGLRSPKLRRLEVTLRDLAFVDRLIDYCAGREDGDRAAAVEAQVAAFSDQIRSAFGFEPDSSTVVAYRRFLEGASTLQIDAHPRKPVDLSRLRFYKAADVPRLLGLEVSAR